jgi:hypothetical protein
MAKKNFQNVVKGYMNEPRPSTMQELLSDNEEIKSTENRKPVNTINTNPDKPIIRKNGKPEKSPRYELRPDEELDMRFRRYMFEQRKKANKTLSAALSQFLKSQGY